MIDLSNYKIVSNEVYYLKKKPINIDKDDVRKLISLAKKNDSKKIRLCFHDSINSTVHEMLIVHFKGTYVQPHKHIGKSESFHIIEGSLGVLIFDDSGKILQVIHMGESSSGLTFYYRLSESYFHSVIPLTETVVFHETTNGSFKREDMISALWAPKEEEAEETEIYFKSILPQLGAITNLVG